MPDHPGQTTPADSWHRLVIAETLAAAHQLQAMGHRLETLAECLPLPPQDVRTEVFESGSEAALDAHPTLALFTYLSVIASSRLFGVSMSLKEAAEQYAPPGLDV